MSMEQWWNDTDCENLEKYAQRNIFQCLFPDPILTWTAMELNPCLYIDRLATKGPIHGTHKFLSELETVSCRDILPYFWRDLLRIYKAV